jgi:hypothetical protein
MKKTAALVLLTAGMFSARAAILMESYNFTNGGTPPDGNLSGLADLRTISSSAIQSITSINVSLNLAGTEAFGAFNGDFYVSLSHAGGFSVLLNRVGRSGSTPSTSSGYGDNGFNITFNDSASNGDIHTYRQTLSPSDPTQPVDPNFVQPLTGIWAPDGRNASILTVTTSDPRTALLASFNDKAVNGDWTLTVIDAAGGNVAVLQSWGITVTGSTVPEPATTAVVAAICLSAFAVVRRTRARKNNS